MSPKGSGVGRSVLGVVILRGDVPFKTTGPSEGYLGQEGPCLKRECFFFSKLMLTCIFHHNKKNRLVHISIHIDDR